MAKGFYLIFLLCYIFGNCVSQEDNGIIKFYTFPHVVTDSLEKFSLRCKVKTSIDLKTVEIYHNHNPMNSEPNKDESQREVSLDTSEEFSGDYICFAGKDHWNQTLKVVIYPTCIVPGSLNKTIVSDFSKKLDRLEHADLEMCLERALYKIVDLTDNSSVNITPSTVPPPTKEIHFPTIKLLVNNKTVNKSEVNAGDDLCISCAMASTVAQKEVRYSWRWTEWNYISSPEDPNMNEFDWSVVLRNDTDDTVITSWPEQCGDSNSTCEGSDLKISKALVKRSGRYFCVVEFPHGVGSVSHEVRYSDIRVVNPILQLDLLGNGKDSNKTVPIVLPYGHELEVNCTATGKWAPPAVSMWAQIGKDQQIVANESSSDHKNKTTAKLPILWEMIKGKDVEFVCKAIGDHESNRDISANLEVSNPITLRLNWNENEKDLKLNATTSITISSDDRLEVSCNATGGYATPKTVNMWARIDGKVVASENESSSIPNTTTTTETLPIPWKKVNGTVVEVECQAIGEYKSNHNSSYIKLKVLIKPTGEGSISTNATSSNTTTASTPSTSSPSASSPSESSPSASPGIFGTPTVFGGIATVLLVVAVIGVLVVAYRSRNKLRSWIMEKDVSKAALRKAKYARAKGGRGWIKYAKLPRDISEAMSHNE